MSFTANRKTQSEIEKCIKKIADGIEVFDELLDAVQEQGQKDKFDELKKEIKKLQKLRDSIKNYLTMSDVKNKQPLIDQRKLIETKMEAFKHCERTTKTKAYSKEGLAAATARGAEDKEKIVQREWLTDSLKSLNDQIDGFEYELEQINVNKKKKSEANRVSQLMAFIKRHRFHERALEKTLRLLENDDASPEQVEEMHDDIEYYLESNQEPDFFYEDEDIYQPVGLTLEDIERQDDAVALAAKAAASLDAPVITRSTLEEAAKEKVLEKLGGGDSAAAPASAPASASAPATATPAAAAAPAAATAAPASSGAGASSKSASGGTANATPAPTAAEVVMASPVKKPKPANAPGAPTAAAVVAAAVAAGTQPTAASIVAGTNKKTPTSSGTTSPAMATSPPSTKRTVAATPVAAAAPAVNTAALLQKQEQERAAAAERARAAQQQQQQQQQQQLLQQQQLREAAAKTQAQQQQQQQQQQKQALLQQQQREQQQREQQQREQQQREQAAAQQQRDQQAARDAQLARDQQMARELAAREQQALLQQQQQQQQKQQQPQAASVSAATAPASASNVDHTAAVAALMGQVTADGQVRELMARELASAALLQQALGSMPESDADSSYQPQSPVTTPSFYPQTVNSVFEQPSTFEKFDTDTLFFIFYYQQGTYSQGLAARELRKKAWRFHKKYLTWFQRHEEPKEISADYEQGTYVYFDWEHGWCQRKKELFTFEYRFLESSAE